MALSMEAAPVPGPAPKERPLDQFQGMLQSLHDGEPLNPEELHKLSFLVQTKYIDAFFPSRAEAEKEMTEWLIGGSGGIFRDFWDANKTPKEGGEGFRDLCLRAIQEEDEKNQKALFEKVSQRLGDGVFAKTMH